MSIEHAGEVAAPVGEEQEEEEEVVAAVAPLHTALRDDYGEFIINFLTHADAGRLELCLPRASVFAAPGATPLLRTSNSGRAHLLRLIKDDVRPRACGTAYLHLSG